MKIQNLDERSDGRTDARAGGRAGLRTDDGRTVDGRPHGWMNPDGWLAGWLKVLVPDARAGGRTKNGRTDGRWTDGGRTVDGRPDEKSGMYENMKI